MTLQSKNLKVQFFQDPQYHFQALRALAATYGGAADIGECLSAIEAIEEGNDESWYEQWSQLASRIESHAELSKAEGMHQSAKAAFLRASNYYRSAEFFLHNQPSDPRLVATWKKSRECFQNSLSCSKKKVSFVRIPYENTTLPGYLCFASEEKRPLVIVQSGFDGTAEELYFQIAVHANSRGFHCLLFEGPGQGEMIREQGIPFRYDWEKVVSPVVDFAEAQPYTDPSRIALYGLSFGGYLVPRALAFEKRIKLGIANGGVYDFHEVCTQGSKELDAALDLPEAAQEVDREIFEIMKKDPGIRWVFANGMYTFKASTPSQWLKSTRPYHLRDHAKNIACKMLVVDSENDHDMPGQSKKLFEALLSSKDFLYFSAKEGAGEHCQMGAYAYSNERIFNWISKHL